MNLKNYSKYLCILLFFCANSLFSQKKAGQKKPDSNQISNQTASKQFANVNFASRIPGFGGSVKIKGDFVMIGNQIINRTSGTGSGDVLPTFDAGGLVTNLAALTTRANTAYNGDIHNGRLNFEYVDVDTDPLTFSSSTSSLALKDFKNDPAICKKIVYAGLYWSAFYPYDRTVNTYDNNGNQTAQAVTPITNNNWNQVKFKVPGGAYVNLTADTAADAAGDEDEIIVREAAFDPSSSTNSFGSPYVCYKNVTNLLKALANPDGTYAVADMLAGRGNPINGLSAGWSLVIIYENPTFPPRFINIADGYQLVTPSATSNYSVSGFKTPLTSIVKAKVGIASLDGDRSENADILYDGDTFSMQTNGNGYKKIKNERNKATPDYNKDDFFNSSVTVPRPTNPFTDNVTSRVPASSNTLGFDLDVATVFNPSNSLIGNNATNADFRLATTKDEFGAFLQAFAVDIIEPKIILTKEIKSIAGVVIPNNTVLPLNRQFNYVIGFQNAGNDDAKNLVITDVLPLNVNFNLANSIFPAGVTQNYVPATRTLTLTVDNNLVQKQDQRFEVILEVSTPEDCRDLLTACGSIVSNTATATYIGDSNTAPATQQSTPSYSATCSSDSGPSTFLIDIASCGSDLVRNEVLCQNNNLTLTAPLGYTGPGASYTWTNAANATIGSNQTQTVNTIGVYKVVCVKTGCATVTITFNVAPDTSITNPIIAFSNPSPPVCLDGFDSVSDISLCGLNDFKEIKTGITSATLTWQKMEASCTLPSPGCANDTAPCWPASSTISTGPNFTANAPGVYRVIIQYQGGVLCSKTFYFRVTQGNLDPKAQKTNIICTTPGQIVITANPAYQFRLEGPVNIPAAANAYQASNTFTIPVANPGTYLVKMRLAVPVAGACEYVVRNINISKITLDSKVEIISSVACSSSSNLTTVNVQAIGGVGPYTYTIRLGAATVGAPISTPNTEASFNLSPGTYSAEVSSSGGCSIRKNFTITIPGPVSGTLDINKPLIFCASGEIRVNSVTGGTPPYFYYFDGATIPSLLNTFTVTTAGSHTAIIEDSNGCKSPVLNVNMPNYAEPTFNPTTQTNVTCDPQGGAFQINVLNNFGYTLTYNVNGTSLQNNNYTSSTNYTGLIADVYKIKVRCTITIGSVNYVCEKTLPNVTITRAQFSALTASGGVSRLAGCFPPDDGEVRITNEQGGVPPYQYSFDNGVTYGPTKSKSVGPGSYVLIIKDSQGCTFKMFVTVSPRPTPPTIVAPVTNSNCDGTGNAVVTITNGVGFNFTYALDGVLNTPPENNVFTNVPCRPNDYKITVGYESTIFPTYSNLLNEDFGVGTNTPLPPNTIAAAYCYNDQVSGTCPDPRLLLEDNQYVVTRAIIPNNGYWFQFKDHTSTVVTPTNPTGTPNPNGRFLAINIGKAAGDNGVLYSKRIYDVIPDQPIIVEAYVANLVKSGQDFGLAGTGFSFEIRTSSGVLLAQKPAVPIQDADLLPRTDNWIFKSVELDPGSVVTPYLIFNVISQNTKYFGNDAAIDDIKVFQVPESCINEQDFYINIRCNAKFTAAVTAVNNVDCFGSSTGSVQISAANFNTSTGFYYSLTGGAPFLTSLVSPITVPVPPATGLPAGPVNIVVKYDLTSTGCIFPFNPTISQPTQLSVGATVKPATCLTGGIITALPSGGISLAYQYQLLTTSLAVVPGFAYGSPNIVGNTISNVPVGTYIIQIKDANNCTIDSATTVTVGGATEVDAKIDPSSELCYDNSNQATIVIGVSGGLAPYNYSSVPPITFTGPNGNQAIVTPGTYVITVTDANGCKDVVTQIIAQQLSIGTSFKDIDCSALPGATITANILGGTAPFSYQVKLDSGAFLPATPIAIGGSTINLPASGVLAAGTYTIRVTDSKNCPVDSLPITINPITPVAGTATPTNASCGLANGTVIILATAGAGPFTYSFNNSAYTTTTVYSTIAGTFQFGIKDRKGCEFTDFVTVGSLLGITAVTTPTQPSCPTDVGSIVFSNLLGGSGNYEYSIGGAFLTTSTINGLGAGSYPCSVKDVTTGCIFPIDTEILTGVIKPTDISFSTVTAANCSPTQFTATIQLTATATYPIIKYEIVLPIASVGNITGATSGIFAGLVPGTTYKFKVTDDKNCTYTEDYTVPVPQAIGVSGQLIKNVVCFNSETGAIRYTVSGFSPGTYSYSVAGTAGTTAVPSQIGQSATTINLINLAAGTYTITVTNETNFCTNTANVTVQGPPSKLIASNLPSPIQCNGVDGQVQLSGSGGWGGYTYSLLSPTNVPISGTVGGLFTGLTITGLYTGTVTDANGCAETTTFTLNPIALPTVTIDPTTFCVNATGVANVGITISGGTGSYTYSLDSGSFLPAPASSFTIPVLPQVAAHTIEIKDSLGCSSGAQSFVISPKLTLETSFALQCGDATASTISGTVSNGYPSYGYQVFYSATAITLPLPTTTLFLPALPIAIPATNSYVYQTVNGVGFYVIRITDSKGCTVDSQVIEIKLFNQPTATSTADDVVCNGEASGVITIEPSGGQAPYEVFFNGSLIPSTSLVYSGLTASGTPYTYVVKDANGCEVLGSQLLINKFPKIKYDIRLIQITCDPGNPNPSNGSIIVENVTGGATTGSLTYQLFSAGNPIAIQTYDTTANPRENHTFSGLTFGLYTVIVTDINGCPVINSPILLQSNPDDLQVTSSGTPSCGPNSGTLTIKASSSVGNLNPLGAYWFAIQTNPPLNFTTAPPGTFILGTYNDNGTPLNPIDDFFSVNFPGLTPGSLYTFVVYSADLDCYYSSQANVSVPPQSQIKSTPIANNITCFGGSNGSTTFSVTGFQSTLLNYQIYTLPGNTPFGALVTNAVTVVGTPFIVNNFGVLPLGQYYIQFTEVGGPNAGCVAVSDPFNITAPASLLTISANSKDDSCKTNGGLIEIFAGGGSGGFSYQCILESVVLANPANYDGSNPLNPLYIAFLNTFVPTSTFNVEAGTWIVYVKDQNGCVKSVTKIVGSTPDPTIALSITNPCPTSSTSYSFTATGGSGVAPYQYFIGTTLVASNPIAGPTTITVNNSGPVTVKIVDKNGCSATDSIIINAPITAVANEAVSPTCAVLPDGQIQVTANGGTGIFTYSISPNPGNVITNVGGLFSNVPPNVPAGSEYTIKVTDNSLPTGCEKEVKISIAAPKDPVFNLESTLVSCFDNANGNSNSNGTIKVILGAGNTDIASYTYAITSGPLLFAPQPGSTFTGLVAGFYEVEVVSGKGCKDKKIIEVKAPTQLSVTPSIPLTFKCTPANITGTTSFTLTGFGGTVVTSSDYTYSIDGTNYFSSGLFENIPDTGAQQNITVYVKDKNGCIATNTLTINPLLKMTAPSVTVGPLGILTCSNLTESITILGQGGSGNYTYEQLGSGNAATSLGIFNLTASGTYTFKVTDTSTLCTILVEHKVNSVPDFNISLNPTGSIVCNGGNTAGLSFTISGYSGTFNYEVYQGTVLYQASTPANTAVSPTVVSGVPAGNYTVKVVQLAAPFCTKTSSSVNIGQPDPLKLDLVSNVPEICIKLAQVTVNATFGTPPYKYAFVLAGSPVPTVFNNASTESLPYSATIPTLNNYTVYVQDFNGCISTPLNVTITRTPDPTISPVSVNQCVLGATGFTLQPIVATGFTTPLTPLTFSINGVAGPFYTLANLPQIPIPISGSVIYQITVKDANGCTASTPLPPVYPSLDLSLEISKYANCIDPVTGSITVTGLGGTGNYTFSLKSPVPVGSSVSGNVISGIPAGSTQTVIIKDGTTTCERERQFTMPAPTAITLLSPTINNPICFGDSNGSFSVNLTPTSAGVNDDPIYQYSILSSNPPGITRPDQFLNTFSNLPEGIYLVQVSSGIGCKETQSVTLDAPSQIVVDVPNIKQFGCTESNKANIASIEVIPATDVIGGSGLYSIYEFSLAGTVVQSGISPVLNILNEAGGIYTVKVFDNKGCSGVSAPITIDPFVKIKLSDPPLIITGPIDCPTNSEDIEVKVDLIFPTGIAPFTVPLTYSIAGIGSTVYAAPTNNDGVFNNLPVGQYKITVTNPATGCFVSINHTVADPSLKYIVKVENKVDVKCFNQSTGSVTIRLFDQSFPYNPVTDPLGLTANVGPFSYVILNSLGVAVVLLTISPNANAVPINNLAAGSYTAVLKLVNFPECSASFGFVIDQPEELKIDAKFGTGPTCYDPKRGSLIVTVSGGTQFTTQFNPYNITIQETTTLLTYTYPDNASNLPAGNYVAIVTDANGCSKTSSPAVPLIAAVPTTASVQTILSDCEGDSKGSITVNVVIPPGGFASDYAYLLNGPAPDPSVDGPSQSNTFIDLIPGTYTVDVIDLKNGCNFTTPQIIITDPPLLVPSLSILTPQSCGVDAVLTLSAIGGTPPYTYSPDGVTYSLTTFTPTTPVTISAPAGFTYSYFVKDAKGCIKKTDEILIPVVPAITLKSQSVINVTCFNGADGKITVQAQGGFSVDYTYSLALTSGGAFVDTNTTGFFNDLTVGNNPAILTRIFYITVTSPGSCPEVFEITVSQPKQFIVTIVPKTVNCFGGLDGSIEITIENANGQVQYAISTLTNSSTANQFFPITSTPDPITGIIKFTIKDLKPDSYLLTVQDAFNCPYNTPIAAPIVIGEPSPVVSALKSILGQSPCLEDLSGSFDITIFGGTLPYKVSIDGGLAVPINGTTTYIAIPATGTTPAVIGYFHTFTGLAGGLHKVKVIDGNGCELPYDVELAPSVFLNPVVVIKYPCPDPATGILNTVTVNLDPSINLLDVEFSLDSGSFQKSNVFTNVPVTLALHTIQVSHVNGCSRTTAPFKIVIIDPLTLKLTEGNLNEIIAITTGGVAPYNYTFNNVFTGPQNTYIYDKTDNYVVTVRDKNDCSITVSRVFNFIDIFIPNFFSPNGDGENENWSPQNTFNYPNLVFYVFDRYGRKIASLKEGQFWDGKYEGQELPTGDYWYIVKTEETSSREFVGNFTLYR